MLQLPPVSASSLVEWLRTAAGRRALAIGLAIAIEALLLLMLLSFGVEKRPGREEKSISVVDIRATEEPQDSPEPSRQQSERPAEAQPQPQRQPTAEPVPSQQPVEQTRPQPPVPAQPQAQAQPEQPPAPSLLPIPDIRLPSAGLPRPGSRPAPSGRSAYGPPDRGGGGSFLRDTERVGTAPNGEPMYAAAWYREPKPEDLGAYLATARGPGWGMIACRTVPDYRVEDCVPIAEYPEGSQINRAILAAAWEFRVRPPRRGGQPLIGTWVQIRITYDMARRP